MLQPKISLTKTGNLVTVDDETGAYAPDNLGGYGVPNAERAALRLGVLVDRRSFKERFTVTVTANPFDAAATVAESWFVNLPGDSLYDYLLIAAYPYNPDTAYVANAVVFNPLDSLFYKAIHPMLAGTLPADERYWQVLEQVEDYPLTRSFAVTGAYFALVQKTHTHAADNKFLVAALNFGKHSCNCEGLGDQATDYAKLLMYRYGIYLNEAIQPPDYKAAGRGADHLNEMLDGLKDDCEC